MVEVYFDNNLISSDSIFNFTQRALLFKDTFSLGSTVCREVDLWVDKNAVTSQPSSVRIEVDGNIYATLHIDSITDNNDYYYSYVLLDSMVLLNQTYEWPEMENPTLQDIIDDICSKYNLGTAPVLDYAGDLVVNYQDYVTARELVGYAAELQGGFAFINNEGRLVFKVFNHTPVDRIEMDQMADLELGADHNIHRIVYNSVQYAEYGDSEGDTLYLNTDNILFTDEPDSEGYHISDMVDHIGQIVYGLQFSNMKISDCILPEAGYEVGDLLAIECPDGIDRNIIVEPNWNYNNAWTGGLDLEVKTTEQEETEVVNSTLDRVVNNVNVRINRQDGQIDLIGQRTDDMESTLIHFQIDSASSSVRVTNEEVNPPQSYTAFQGDGMRVYVNGEQVAEATAQRFECDKGLGVQDWAIEHGEDAEVLMIYRRR